MAKKEHGAPLRCHLLVLLFGHSPSAKAYFCDIACRYKSRKCYNCTSNIPYMIHKGFQQGLAAFAESGVADD